MSALDTIDAASEAVRADGAFRVTADDLRERVASVEYIERGVLNVALVQLDNGWWLVGKSAPVDLDNYDAEFGRKLAHDDALRQAWPLLAFAHLEATAPDPVAVEVLVPGFNGRDSVVERHDLGRTWFCNGERLVVVGDSGALVAEYAAGTWRSARAVPTV